MLRVLNPFTLKRDWRLISPYNITLESQKGHENKENDLLLKKLLIAQQPLTVNTFPFS